MIAEVLADIVDAEKEAEQILAEANTEARNIGIESHAAVERLKNEQIAQTKIEVKSIMAAAELEADAMTKERMKQAELNAAQLVKAADKHLQRTVEWLAENVVKHNRKQ